MLTLRRGAGRDGSRGQRGDGARPGGDAMRCLRHRLRRGGTTATKGAELDLGGRSSAEPLAKDTRGENQAKGPHCRDTKAGCHAAKIKARAKKAAKLPAEQAETKKQNRTSTLPTFAGLSAAIVAKHKVTTLTLTLTLTLSLSLSLSLTLTLTLRNPNPNPHPH